MLAKLRDAFVTVTEAGDWKALMQQNRLDPYKGTMEQFMIAVRKESVKLGDDYLRLKLPQE